MRAAIAGVAFAFLAMWPGSALEPTGMAQLAAGGALMGGALTVQGR